VIGAALIPSCRRSAGTPEIVVLAAGSALAPGFVDVYHSASGVLSKLYPLDAPVEAALAAAWIFPWNRDE